MLLISRSGAPRLQNTTPTPAAVSSEVVLLSTDEVMIATPRTSLSISFRIKKQNIESPVPGSGLEPTDDFRKIGIGYLRNHKSEQIALAGCQPPRMSVLVIVEL